MSIQDYLHVIRRRWALIVLVFVLAFAAAVTYCLVKAPQYTSTAKAYVSTQSAANLSDLNFGGSYAQQVVKSYADVATTPFVLNSVIRQLKLEESPESLASHITASAQLDTVVLQVEATYDSPAEAAGIANAVVARLSSAVDRLTPGANGTRSAISVTQIQSAVPAVGPSSPKVPLILMLSAVLGLLAGLALAAIVDRADTRVRNIVDVERMTPTPIIGAIWWDAAAAASPLIVSSDASSLRAEAFKSLRTNLQFLDIGHSRRSFVITSSVDSEGKSSTSSNLAVSLAEAGQRVLLIDADLRRPKLAEYFALDAGIGLTDVLIGDVDIDDAVQHWGSTSLDVLPAGRVPPNPSELLQSAAMRDALKSFAATYDYVLIDTPPLLPVTDAAILAKLTSGALLVASAARLRRPQLRLALASLERVAAPVLGVIVSMLPAKGPGGYGWYGYETAYGASGSKGGRSA